jgi:hypothetical protein
VELVFGVDVAREFLAEAEAGDLNGEGVGSGGCFDEGDYFGEAEFELFGALFAEGLEIL